jgi:hypothetical protein
VVEIEDETPWLLRGSLLLLTVGAVACLTALNADLPRHLRPDALLGSIYTLAIGGICLMVWIVRQRKELDRRVLLVLEGSINKALEGKGNVANRQILDNGQRSIAVSEDGTRLAFTAVMKEPIRSVAHEDGPYVFDSYQIVRAWVEKDTQTIITTHASGGAVDIGGAILGGSTARSTARTYTTGFGLSCT